MDSSLQPCTSSINHPVLRSVSFSHPSKHLPSLSLRSLWSFCQKSLFFISYNSLCEYSRLRLSVLWLITQIHLFVSTRNLLKSVFLLLSSRALSYEFISSLCSFNCMLGLAKRKGECKVSVHHLDPGRPLPKETVNPWSVAIGPFVCVFLSPISVPGMY